MSSRNNPATAQLSSAQLSQVAAMVQQMMAAGPGAAQQPGGPMTGAPTTNQAYQCNESWATCPAGKPYCYWGDQPYNKGKCCLTPWSASASCVPATSRAPMPVSTLPPTVAPYSPMPDSDGEDDMPKPRRNGKGPVTDKYTMPPISMGGGGTWKKATATWYTSYPECCHDKKADQSECEDYSGCKYEGMFAAFNGKKSKDWVKANNIVAFYAPPNAQNRKEWAARWKNKRLRIRYPKTGKTLDVTVVDTCDDGDCSGCCSKNAKRNGNNFLIDLERHTAERFYGPGKIVDVADIEWQEI